MYICCLLCHPQGVDFEYSILFIGYYSNGRTGGIGDINELGSSYKLPIAYLVVMFWAFLISICFILFRLVYLCMYVCISDDYNCNMYVYPVHLFLLICCDVKQLCTQ